MEVAAAPAVPVCAADRCPGPAGAGGAFLASKQQERSAGEGRPSHGRFLSPLLQCWWWGREGALVCYQGTTEQVKLITFSNMSSHSLVKTLPSSKALLGRF